MNSIVILLFVLKYITQFSLSFLNVSYIKKKVEQVPEAFSSLVTLADHQKAAAYAKAKTTFSWPFMLVEIAVSSFWLFGGGLEKLDLYLRSCPSFAGLNQVYLGLIFFSVFSLINMLIDLPESILSTFVLEEKFGFNRTNVKTFFLDMIKQLLLGMILGLPALFGLLTIMEHLGEYWWIYAFLFFVFFQLLIFFIYPIWIAPLFNKFNPLEEGELKNQVVHLLKKIKFDFQGLFVMNASMRSSHGNAYFTGFGKNKRIVFFDTLLKSLSNNEVLAVLAHELGHYKLKHILKSMILAFVFLGFGMYFINFCLRSSWFYSSFSITNPSNYMALILFSLTIPYFTFFLTPIQSFFSRRNEYQADEFSTQYTNGEDLISGLLKMYKDNASFLTPHPLFVKFYHSHPSALERIGFIKSKKPYVPVGDLK